MVLRWLHAHREGLWRAIRIWRALPYLLVLTGGVLFTTVAPKIDLTAPPEPIAFPARAASVIPNSWLVCPTGYCLSSNAGSAIYDASPADLRAAWDAMIARQPRVERVRLDADGLGGTWVQSSARFGFRDRINVRFLASPGGRATLAAHSRSEIGVYDFGVNRRRLETWLGDLAVPEWRFRLSPVPPS